jgi:hypothetical protein
MNQRKIKKIAIIFILCSIFSVGYTSAQEQYHDNFSIIDTSSWTEITSDEWQVVSETASSSVSRSGLIFKQFDDTRYIAEVNIAADDTRIQNYSQVGFYVYYEDSDNYARIVFKNDNREDHLDGIAIESEGVTLTNTQTYIDISTNESIEFNPNILHNLKVVRLGKNIYAYFDGRLALTTEFKNKKTAGKVGFDIYECTGYFDNFYLRPITMENASNYINELNLTSANPSTSIGSIYTLRLEDTANGNAFFSLNKFGEAIDTSVGSEGDMLSLSFENGEEAVTFRVTEVFDAESNSGVWLEELISASTEDLNIGVDDISIEPVYYQEEKMNLSFSVRNNGGIMYKGTPEIVISTGKDSETIYPELVLDADESKKFNVVLEAPDEPGSHSLTVSIDPQYTTIEKAVDYQVHALNPAVTTISTDLQEDNGIRGTVSIGSPFSAELVDWNTTADVRVYKVVDNGKKEIYSRDIPVTSSTFNIALAYNEFYRNDGQYVVTIDVEGMRESELFDIVGEDFAYSPEDDAIPPTILTGELYPKILMLLIGMFAALSVRNHMHEMTRSLPLDRLAVVCGIVLLAAAFIRGESSIAAAGVILTGGGIGIALLMRSNSVVGKTLRMNSHLHDFAGMLVVFSTAGYLIMQVPEWSFVVVVGTLVGYYTSLNLHLHQ